LKKHPYTPYMTIETHPV